MKNSNLYIDVGLLIENQKKKVKVFQYKGSLNNPKKEVCVLGLDAAKKFLEKMKTDSEFVKAYLTCKEPKEIEDFLKKEGFDCSLDEIKELSAELTDDELQSIAGGHGDLENPSPQSPIWFKSE